MYPNVKKSSSSTMTSVIYVFFHQTCCSRSFIIFFLSLLLYLHTHARWPIFLQVLFVLVGACYYGMLYIPIFIATNLLWHCFWHSMGLLDWSSWTIGSILSSISDCWKAWASLDAAFIAWAFPMFVPLLNPSCCVRDCPIQVRASTIPCAMQ